MSAPYVHALEHLDADLLWTRCGLSVNNTPDLRVTETPEDATCPWCFTRTECPKARWDRLQARRQHTY